MSANHGFLALRFGAVLCGIFFYNHSMAINFPDVLDDPLFVDLHRVPSAPGLPETESSLECSALAITDGALALHDIVDITLCNDPQIKAAWLAVKSQASAVGEARAAYLPVFNASTSRLNTQTRYADNLGMNRDESGDTVQLSLNWRLFDFGGRSANRLAANKLLTAALLGHHAAMQKTLATLVGAYFDAQAAEAAVAARKEATTLAERTLATTIQRELRGVASRSDTLQARTALAKANLLERRAIGDQQKAMTVLRHIMNASPTTPLQLSPLKTPSAKDSGKDIEEWLAQTTEHHPAILAVRAQIEAANAKVEAARSEGLPTIDFSGNFYRNGFPNQGLQPVRSDTTTLGVTLNIPFFEGFARTYKIRGLQAQAEQSVLQLAETKRQIASEVVKAYTDVSSAQSNLASSDALLESARDLVKSSEKRYAMGDSNITELLNTQSILVDAQLEKTRSIAEWHSARLRLLANVGVMNRALAGR